MLLPRLHLLVPRLHLLLPRLHLLLPRLHLLLPRLHLLLPRLHLLLPRLHLLVPRLHPPADGSGGERLSKPRTPRWLQLVTKPTNTCTPFKRLSQALERCNSHAS